MFISFRRNDIWINYLSGWFAVDIVSTIPWTDVLVFLGTTGSENAKDLKRSLRLSRLLRLLKLGRMLKIKARLEDTFQIQEGFKEVTNFLIMFALLTHWFACAFYALGDSHLDRQHADWNKETGMYECNGSSLDLADCSWATGRKLYTNHRSENYPAAGYWAVMTLTTVGYGDVSAKFTTQRYLGAFAMVVGALMFAYGVSHIVNIIEELQYVGAPPHYHPHQPHTTKPHQPTTPTKPSTHHPATHPPPTNQPAYHPATPPPTAPPPPTAYQVRLARLHAEARQVQPLHAVPRPLQGAPH